MARFSQTAFERARGPRCLDPKSIKRLDRWLDANEAARFAEVSREQERRARARMAQFETNAAEAW